MKAAVIIHALTGRLRAAAEHVAQTRMNKTRKDTEASNLFSLDYLDFPFPLQLSLKGDFRDYVPSLSAGKQCELSAPLKGVSRILKGISNFPAPSGTQR